MREDDRGMENKEEYREVMEEMIMYSALMYQRGLVSASGGNVSARCGPEHFLITASGASFRSLSFDDILLCGFDGEIVDGGGNRRVSKEYRMHAGCYLARPEITRAAHLHPSHTIAVTAYDVDLPLFTASARLKLKSVPTIGCADPGTIELARLVREKVELCKESRAFLLKAHGVILLGTGMEECFELAELLEDTARIALLAKDKLLAPLEC